MATKKIEKLKKEIASMEAVYSKQSTSEATKKILKRSIEAAKTKLEKQEELTKKLKTAMYGPKPTEEPKKEEPKKEEPSKPKKAAKPSTALSKLMRRVRSKGYEPYKGKKIDLLRDGGRKAKAPGKKVSKSGRTYWESRPNRVDLKQKAKKSPYLKEGGTVPSSAYGDMVYNTLESALSSIKSLVKPQNYSILKKDKKYMVTTNRRSGIFSKEGWENFGHVLSNSTLYKGTIGRLEFGGVAGYDEGGEMADGGWIDDVTREMNDLKKKYPKSKVTYFFAKNPNGKNYVIEVKEGNKVIYTTYDDKKMAEGGSTSSPNTEFMKWFVDWSKSVNKYVSISISIPNEFSSPIKDGKDKIVILDVIEKKGDADAKKYMDEILKKADELGVSIYLQPIPRTHNLKSEEHKKKITKDYLIKYYGEFGFENTDGGFMVREPKMALGGYMAKGGATEHGLMVGDMIVLVKGSIIGIIDENGEPVSVNIETGDRRSAKEKKEEGGETEYAGGGNVMKEYEKVEGTNYELKIQVYYDKGGMNYFTSRPEQRGYYASVTPVQVERRPGGIMVESYAAFSGVKMLVLPVQRQSPKAEAEAKEKAMQVLPELKEAIKERIKSKMGK